MNELGKWKVEAGDAKNCFMKGISDQNVAIRMDFEKQLDQKRLLKSIRKLGEEVPVFGSVIKMTDTEIYRQEVKAELKLEVSEHDDIDKQIERFLLKPAQFLSGAFQVAMSYDNALTLNSLSFDKKSYMPIVQQIMDSMVNIILEYIEQ